METRSSLPTEKPASTDDALGIGERTTLTRMNATSHSLRTTVPKGIASHFELRPGDTVVWSIAPSRDETGLMIIVTPERGDRQ